MERFLTAVKDWPVIVQGALGSALFALTLYLGQKLFHYASEHFVALSSNRRKKQLRHKIVRLNVYLAKDYAERSYYTSLTWIRASRELARALLWLALGLITGSIFGVLSIVGYLGCIYYLFATLNVVGPMTVGNDAEEELRKLYEELKKLEENDG